MRFTVWLAPRSPFATSALADAVSDPTSPTYGAHLDRHALESQFGRTREERAAIRTYFEGRGFVFERPTALGESVMSFVVDGVRLTATLGADVARALGARRVLGADSLFGVLPGELAVLVQSVELARDGHVESEAEAGRSLDMNEHDATEPPPSGVGPSELLRLYDVCEQRSGRGETIALMALGGTPRAVDVATFFHAHGIPAPDVRLVPLGPRGTYEDDELHRFETTMAVEWIGTVAPGARIVVYLVDPTAVADPWATFLQAVIGDHRHAPTVAVTTWSCPERQYYRAHGRSRIRGLLDRCAALGVTVVAASGDWGAHGGFPRIATNEGPICNPSERHATFPGVEERVLSVGGTHLRSFEPRDEVAWSAPVSEAIHRAVGLERLAGGGGFSDVVPLPDWQRSIATKSHPRTSGPSVVPHGRAQPDFALMAWGPDHDGHPSAYRARIDGRWRSDAGGTSVAAPIGAAIVARLNESRRARGASRLGFVQPLLYRAALATPEVFRSIEDGSTNIVLPGHSSDGSRSWFTLPGFRAGRGWNPAVGFGVPDVAALERSLDTALSAPAPCRERS